VGAAGLFSVILDARFDQHKVDAFVMRCVFRRYSWVV
jgi:hypothetical protein